MIDQDDKSVSFAFDRRGVSEVVGSILVFGLLVALIAIIQVQGIPSANEEVEFEHSQAVEQDISQLRVAMSQTADTGESRRSSVKIGTTYPSRLLFFNPPPVQGSLRTSDTANITLENVASDSAAGVYFSTSNVHNYSTRSLIYSVDYNRMKNSPNRVQEAAVYYRDYEGRSLVGASNFIDGSTINLVAIGGNLSANAIDARTIETTALSGPETEYQIRNNNSGPISVSIPTNLGFEAWNETLRDEYATNADINGTTVTGSSSGRITRLTYIPNSSGFSRLTVELKSGRYNLRMSKIGVGSGGDVPAKYVVPSEGSGSAAVKVRDAFNNPVSGVELEASVPSGNTISNGTHTGNTVIVHTGPDGTASVSLASVSGTVPLVNYSGDLDQDGTVESIETTKASPITGSRSVFISDVTGTDGTNTVTLQLQNLDGSTKEIRTVNLQEASQYQGKLMVEDSNLVGVITGTLGLNLVKSNATYVQDGPDAVTGVSVDGTSLPMSGGAAENSMPAAVSPGPGLTPGATTDVVLEFDQSYDLNNRDSLVLNVELSFSDGTTESYDVVLHNDDR